VWRLWQGLAYVQSEYYADLKTVEKSAKSPAEKVEAKLFCTPS
jgi:hypothetical protein